MRTLADKRHNLHSRIEVACERLKEQLGKQFTRVLGAAKRKSYSLNLAQTAKATLRTGLNP